MGRKQAGGADSILFRRILYGHFQIRSSSNRILPYFKKLLAANPNWKWETIELFPTQLGFVVKWKASIPVRRATITEFGIDIVDMEEGRITRNEVYFLTNRSSSTD